MKPLVLVILLLLQATHQVFCVNPCAPRAIAGADSVCVCNETYCDDFPPLRHPSAGSVFVYESGKSGNRFKEFTVKMESNAKNSFDSKETQTITLDKSKTFQEILGFGGAFTDFTGFVITSVPKSLSESLLKSYFSDNGIQYNIGRVPIAGTDYSFRWYTYDDVNDDKALQHFALTDEDFKYKIPVLKAAKTLSPGLRLFGSPWNAPKWIKTAENGPANIKNQLKGDTGGEYYEIWAKYFIKFLDAYKAQNLSMWGITVQNEPTWGRQFNDLFLDGVMEREFVKKNLGPHLHQNDYTPDKLKLMIYDDNVNYTDGRPSIQNYTKTILTDTEAKKYVQGIAYHWYESSRTTEYPDNILEELHTNYPDQFQLMTEACHLEGTGNGKWEFGEHYAHDIIRDINHWAKGWVEWNMALGLSGCDRCNPNQCGSSILVDINKKEAYKQPSFYAIGHFSKFIVSDSVRIQHTLTKQIQGLYVLSAKRPDNGIVVVVLNQNDHSIDLLINESHNRVSHTIPERTIQTYLWY